MAEAHVVVREPELLGSEQQRDAPGVLAEQRACPHPPVRSAAAVPVFCAAVVPTTSEQSATASATLGNTLALCSTCAPPTAETASRNASS